MTSTEGFKRHGDHSYIAHFADSEKEVLLNLCEQIIELLAERVDHGHEDPLAAMVGITLTIHRQKMKYFTVYFPMHMQMPSMLQSFDAIQNQP